MFLVIPGAGRRNEISDIWFDMQGWLICGSLLVVSVRLLVVCSRLVVVCSGLRSFVGGLWSLLRPRLTC